jgi:hypothetical protein
LDKPFVKMAINFILNLQMLVLNPLFKKLELKLETLNVYQQKL